MQHRPMQLVRLPDAFDHPDWLFELKHEGGSAPCRTSKVIAAGLWIREQELREGFAIIDRGLTVTDQAVA